MQKGVFRWIGICAVLWITVIMLMSCGSNGEVKVDNSQILEERQMTEEELGWWDEVAGCLENSVADERVHDVPHPKIIIMQDTYLEWANEYGFKCSGEWVRECADDSTIAIGLNQYRQRLFDHGACHVFELNLTGSGSNGHTTNWWIDRGACICEVHLR